MTTVTLPPGPSTPRFVQVAYSLTMPRRGMPRLRDRYGDAFTINMPIFGHAVVISDPAEIKQLFQARSDVADNLERNLGRVLGPGSLFALAGEEHRTQRKLLVPPFNFGAPVQGAGSMFRMQQGELFGTIYGRVFLTSCDQLPNWTVDFRAQCGPGQAFQVTGDGLLVWTGTGNALTDGITRNLWQTSLPGAQAP